MRDRALDEAGVEVWEETSAVLSERGGELFSLPMVDERAMDWTFVVSMGVGERMEHRRQS